MPLTEKQKQLVVYIDGRVDQILSNGGNDEELLLSLYDVLDDLKKIMDLATHHEMDALCAEYTRFDWFMKLLNLLDSGIFNENTLVASSKN